MIKHSLDVQKSKMVYEHCKSHIAMKECYNNVFNVVTDYIFKFRSSDWKVAYGYMTVFDNLLCRHCFIIDENENVIDPTILAGSKSTDREYYSMKIFDDIDDYFDAIQKENYFPALDTYLKENAVNAQIWANKNGFILTG